METKLHRLEAAVEYLKNRGLIHRQKDIAIAMNASPATISGALAGSEKNLTDRFLVRFNQSYGNIFRDEWLINGDGDMLAGSGIVPDEDGSYTTYLLPLAAMAGTLTGFDTTGVSNYECERIIVPIAGVDFAVPVYGDSMSPEYPSGTRVLVKRVNPDAFIAWGSVYVLDTTNGMLLKEVQPCEDDDDFVTCHSLNPSGRYKDSDVKRTHIRAMYRVLASITMK